jgi:MFS family permease
MNAAVDITGVRARGRDPVTWYCYLLLGYFTYLISIQGNILPFLKVELDLSYGAVSLHTSAIAAGVIVVGLIGERVVRRFGRRLMLVASVTGSAVAVLLLTLAAATWASIGASFLFGMIGGFIPAMVPAILSDIHGRRRDIAYAESNAVAYVFSIMAPILTGLFVWAGWGWRLAVVAGAATGAIIVLSAIHRPVPNSLETREAAAAPLSLAFWCFWAVLGLSVAVEFSILLWAPAFLERVGGLSSTSAAFAAAAFFAGMLIGRLAGGPLFDKFATRRLFFGAVAITLIGFAGYWGTTGPVLSVAGLFITGLGVALLFPLGLSFAIGAAGDAADRASTRVMLGPGLAILLSPPLLGLIADKAGLGIAQLMTPVFMVLAMLAFVAGEFARRLRPVA